MSSSESTMSHIRKGRKRKGTDLDEVPSETRRTTIDGVANVPSDDDENDEEPASSSYCERLLTSQEQSNEADEQHEEQNHLKRRKTAKFKKHPDAPKRFRSAFIIYSQQRHKELRAKLNAEGGEIDTMNIAGQISDEWRTIGQDAKLKWEEMARNDKERYQREKAEYSGPWKVRTNLRKPKDPNSPKKPVPAYFAFSNERRQEAKNKNPNSTNGEVSRMLSKMWKEAPDEVRKRYIEKEAMEREKYAESMTEWKEKRKREDEELAEEDEKVNSAHDDVGHKSYLVEGISSARSVTASSGLTDRNTSQSNMQHEDSSYGQSRAAFNHFREHAGDFRLNQPSTSNSYDAYTRRLQEEMLLQQGFLGNSMFHQRSQPAPINQDTSLWLQLLSRVPTTPQQTIYDRDSLQQIMMSVLQRRNVSNGNQSFLPVGMSTESGQGSRIDGNVPNGAAASVGEQLARLMLPQGWPSNSHHAMLPADSTFNDGINFFNMQRTSTGTGTGVGLIDESLLRQLLGRGTTFGGVDNNSFQGGSNFGAESMLLFRMLEQQEIRVGVPTLSAASIPSAVNSNTPFPPTTHDDFLQTFLQQLGAAAASKGGAGTTRRSSPP